MCFSNALSLKYKKSVLTLWRDLLTCPGHAFPIVTLSFFLLPSPSFIASSSGLSSLVCKYFNKVYSNAFWHKVLSVHSGVFCGSVASLHLWMRHNKIELLMLLEGTSWAGCYLLLCQSNYWTLRRWIAAQLVWVWSSAMEASSGLRLFKAFPHST